MPVDLDIHADDAGQRVDRFLRKLLPKAPLSLVHRLLRQGAVRVDGAKVDGSFRLAQGAKLELGVDEERFRGMTTGEAPKPTGQRAATRLVIVYEDDDVLVVDKPGGLAVHGGTGQKNDHLVARLRTHVESAESHTFRPAPAHRIDRATSGLVVVGKNAAALRALTAAFRDHLVEKNYVAVVHDRPNPPEGTIDQAIAVRDATDARAAKTELDEQGLVAVTHYRTRTSRRGLSLVEARIDTGRTHQVRAHLASIGCPIVGDRRYGAPDRPALGAHRIALHAARLTFPHPRDGHAVRVKAAVPPEFEGLLDQRGAAPTTSARRRKR